MRRPASFFLRLRRGQALIEFALVALPALLLATAAIGILTFLLQGGITNSVAQSASVILDRQFDKDLVKTEDDAMAKALELRLYDESQLVLSTSEYLTKSSGNQTPLAEINLAMLSLYQFDADRDVYRFPGAVVQHSGSTGGETVLIPIVSRTGDSEQITDWKRPVSITPVLDSSGQTTSYRVTVTFPAQAAGLVSYPADADGNTSGLPYKADDGAVVVAAQMPQGYSLSGAASENPAARTGVNRGEYGLGELYNFTYTVRPYRRVFEFISYARIKDDSVPNTSAGSNL